MLTVACTVIYLACFQVCGFFSIARVVRRGSSADLSVWREWTLLAGICCQLVVMIATGAHWLVLLSPLASACSIGTLLFFIYRFR